ncbi:MAG: Hpt domain-containing protein [Pseudomonadota bacterium]
MAETHDFLALDWVKGEIEETLKQAQQALEAHVENPEDQTRLRFCLTYLHQVYGTLQMVEFYGAALLAEEMEKLTQALLSGKVPRVADAQETLMRGMLQLPAYLDRIKASRRDMPVVLLPLLNDLRAARGEKFLSEGSLFKPDMTGSGGDGEVLVAVAADPNLAELLRKIRQMFQIALVGFIRGENLPTNIGHMAKVSAKLVKVAGDSAIAPLWKVTGAIAEGLASASIEGSTAIKLLLGQVDRQIKLLVEQGAPGFAQKPAPDLFKNLLFYVARSEADSPLIAQVRKIYKLDEALPSDETIDAERLKLAGPDRQTMTTVARAISEELARVKEALDIFMRGGPQSKVTDLSPHIGTLKQIADTIAMLGLGQQRKLVQEQHDILEQIVKDGKLENPALLMDVAGALLYVEATLSGGDGRPQARVPATPQDALAQDGLAKAREAVVRECRAGLEFTKDKIVEYIASQWDRVHIQDVPDTLVMVRGGLQMIGLDRAAMVLVQAANFFRAELLGEDAQPDWKRMDTLADAISSVEYFLERIIEDPESGDHILEIAEKSAADLGYPVSDVSKPIMEFDIPAVVMKQEPDAFAPDADEEIEAHAKYEIPAVIFSNELSDELVAEPTLDVPMTAAEEGKTSFADEESPLIDEDMLALADLMDESSAPGEHANEIPAEEIVATDILPVADQGIEDASVDAEIVEIFVEEIGEVMENFDEYFPQWVANQQDEVSLKEFRRAFHTLKGSGRMVGAKYVGELAWAVENMLNRVIDKTILPTPVMVELIRTVKGIVPDLVDAFAQRRKPPYAVEALMACASAFARGESPDFVPSLAQHDALLAAEGAPDTEIAVADSLLAISTEEDVFAPSSLAGEDVPAPEDEVKAEYDMALMEVFSGEAEQHIATLDAYLASLDPDVAYHPITDELLRALHTLKGSARMAGIMPVAEVAGPTEKFCKELRNNGELADADVIALVREATNLVRLRVRYLLPDPYAPIPGAQSYLEMLFAIQDARHAPRAATVSVEAPAKHAVQPRPGMINALLAEGIEHVLDGGDYAAQWSQQGVVGQDLDALREQLRRLHNTATSGGIVPIADIARRLSRVYDAIHESHLMLANNVLDALQQGHEAIIGMMDCMAAHQSIWPATEVEQLLDAVTAGLPSDGSYGDQALSGNTPTGISTDTEQVSSYDEEEVLFSADEFAVSEAEVIAATGTVEPEDAFDDVELSADDVSLSEEEVLRLTGSVEPSIPAPEGALTENIVAGGGEGPINVPERDPELVEIFLEEAGELVESSGESLSIWLRNADNLIEVQKLQRDLHTLKGGARMAEIAELGDLAHELENLYEGLSQGTLPVRPVLFELLNRCHDRIADMVDDIRSKGWCKDGRQLIAQIHAYIKNPEQFSMDALAAPLKVATVPVPVTEGQASAASEVPRMILPAARPAEESEPVVDADILEIFLEEAEDLTAQLDAAISGWQSEPGNSAHADQIKRVLHTLKGGARLAGLKRLGDVSHEFETRVIDLVPRAPDAAFFAAIVAYHDNISAQVERIRAGGAAAAATNAASTTAKAAEVPVVSAPAALPPEQSAAEPATGLVPHDRKEDKDEDRRGPVQTAVRQAQPQEMVKVPSDLLEKLVNLAGETSINRSRIETQVTDFRYTLGEMGSTISRLAAQLRRLDAEADSQVKANWEKGVAEGKYSGEFDPLEMDQYSALHQLTKQLFESASDLLDIRDTLTSKSRDTETLLLQQSRVNTELQEGLMRSRMVPFSRLIPRLRRIVRQVSGELKKQVDIDFINPEGEMDRALLERIVAPLEHMLRNACDHGVESPQVRIAAGKPAMGRIRLALTREGGEVVLSISDDGNGINVDAVRKKAMERGLMDATSELSDQEVMQFILEAGFSTAEKVTQISGRGVGMDVVSSEIRQMGGVLTIRSEVNQGTTFEIRLPFTVSVNRALMVRIGEEQFAIPLVQIEGIVRVSPYELEAYYQPNAPAFEYAGESYRLDYLGGFVHGVAAPDLRGAAMPLPVLLVRGSEHTVAVQVDQLIGSREVVVKAVGPQLSTVAGISGATILGDGRVVIILDLLSLIRAAHLQHEMALATQRRLVMRRGEATGVGGLATAVRETPLIMVTDDSVTVRKVTGRFLERQGFEVITAKDGMDAVAQLADIKPDIMLLDIEMPRMDGFEVASHCRHDSRLKDLPIIMITSRTGEKHRERAMELGVNAYLGKPFQENELLAKIQELLAERRAQASP